MYDTVVCGAPGGFRILLTDIPEWARVPGFYDSYGREWVDGTSGLTCEDGNRVLRFARVDHFVWRYRGEGTPRWW